MNWIVLETTRIASWLAGFTTKFRDRCVALHFNILEGTVTVTLLPEMEHIEETLERKELIRFGGVRSIDTPTRDTQTLGDLISISCRIEQDTHMCEVLLRDIDGTELHVDFLFLNCKAAAE